MSDARTPSPSPSFRDNAREGAVPIDPLGHPATTVAEDAHTMLVNKVSWGAIFAGVVVGLITQVLLTMLGVGIGIATLDPGMGAAGNPAASTFSIGAGIWYVLSGIVSAYVGGYIAARMSGRTAPTTGALHGLTAWAFTTLLVLYLLTSAIGGIVGGAFSGVTGAIGGLGQTAAPMLANSNPLDAIEGQVRATGTDPVALQAKAVNAIRALVVGGQAGTDDARNQAVQALAQARNIPVDQAQQQVADIEQRTRQAIDSAKETATKAADTAASMVSTGALLAFAALVLGAIAGWLGGRSGVVHPVFADRIVPTRHRV